MEIQTSLVTASDIQLQTKELCGLKLPGPFEADHLPNELKREHESYESQMLYHLGQAMQLHQTRGSKLNESLLRWYETAYYNKPTDVIGDPEWENFYPALVIEDKPWRDFSEVTEATESTQRYLTTQLLTGTLTKKKRERLLQVAQKHVCTLDPRDKDFFTEETLAECLQQEQLGTDKAINRVLDRKHYTPVTKADRREALALVREERAEKLKLSWLFESGNWESFEDEALRAFTYITYSELCRQQPGYCESEFEVAMWDVLREATDRDDEEDYYLDPRDQDTWIGIRDFARAMQEVDRDTMHYDYQDRKYTAQRWIKQVGLPCLYGAKADWWEEQPELAAEPEATKKDYMLLLGNRNRSPREEVIVFKGIFHEGLKDSDVYRAAARKYGKAVEEVLKNA
jgi:hypothetical protein